MRKKEFIILTKPLSCLRKTIHLLSLVIVLLLLSYFGFPSTYLAHDDHRIPEIALSTYIERAMNPTWHWFAGLGQAGHAAYVSEVPLYLIILFLKIIGLNHITIQQILIRIFFVLSGLSMYYLIAVLTGKRNGLHNFVAGLFYAINPFSIAMPFFHFYYLYMYVHAFMPLILAKTVNIIKRGTLKDYALFSLILVCSLPIASNPGYLVILFLPSAIYLLYTLVIRRKIVVIKKAAILVMIFVLINMFWILPLLMQATNGEFRFEGSIRGKVDPGFKYKYKYYSTILNNLRLINWQWYYKLPDGTYAYRFKDLFEKMGLLNSVFFLPAFLAGIALLVSRKRKKEVLFALVLLLVSLILIGGPAEPFQPIYDFMCKYIPFYKHLAQNLYAKYGFHLALAYSIAIGLLTYELAGYSYKNKRQRTYVLRISIGSAMVILLIIYTIPFITGTIGPSHATDVPYYYIEVAQYINTKLENDGTLVYLPLTSTNFERLKWGYYGTPILAKLINKPLIHITYTYSTSNQRAISLLYEAIEGMNKNEFRVFLDMFNVKYIIYNDEVINNITNREKVKEFLKDYPVIYKNHNITILKTGLMTSKFQCSKTIIVGNIAPEVVYALFVLNQVTPPAYLYKDKTYDKVFSSILNHTNYLDLQKIVEVRKIASLSLSDFKKHYENTTRKIVYSTILTLPKNTSIVYVTFNYSSTKPLIATFIARGHIVKRVVYPPNNTVNKAELYVILPPLSSGRISFFIGTYEEQFHISKINVYTLHLRTLATLESVTCINNLYIDEVMPTEYKLRLRSSQPLMIIFRESYSPLWRVLIYRNGKLIAETKSIPIYGIYNGFWINTTGNLTIVIRYFPQDWFELGLGISIATFALCIFYLVWDWRRSRGDRWAIWVEKQVRSIPRYLRKGLGVKMLCKVT